MRHKLQDQAVLDVDASYLQKLGKEVPEWLDVKLRFRH